MHLAVCGELFSTSNDRPCLSYCRRCAASIIDVPLGNDEFWTQKSRLQCVAINHFCTQSTTAKRVATIGRQSAQNPKIKNPRAPLSFEFLPPKIPIKNTSNEIAPIPSFACFWPPKYLTWIGLRPKVREPGLPSSRPLSSIHRTTSSNEGDPRGDCLEAPDHERIDQRRRYPGPVTGQPRRRHDLCLPGRGKHASPPGAHPLHRPSANDPAAS